MTTLVSNMDIFKNGKYVPFFILFLIIFLGAMAAFPPSYLGGTNLLIGLVVFPFALIFHRSAGINWLYFGASVLFASLAFVFEVKMFYFLCLCFTLISAIEFLFGGLNTVVLFLFAAMSPVFQQLAGILGFPIRLELSRAAGSILQTTGLNVSVDGNMITLDGKAFTVDEACMGLNMLAIAILLSVFVLATEMKRRGKTLTFFYVSLFFILVFVLNIGANLFRILTLVLFRIGPESVMHEAMGIVALLIYCILPAVWAAKSLVRRRGRTVLVAEPSTRRNRSFALMVIFCCAITSVAFTIDPAREARMNYFVEVSGMQGEPMKDGMTKFADEAFLIYVKQIPEFFSGEHTPLFCWKGSGYVFEKISEATVDNQIIYTGVMMKGSERLYTAWWYTNGEISTIDQLTWRYRSLITGKSFCLVNVTACDHDQLMGKVNKLFGGDLRMELHQFTCL